MYWKNSNFQIKYFIAGKCHTADEAYRQLKQLLEDRDLVVKNSEAAQLRAQAKKARCNETINMEKSTEADILEAKADLAEMEVFAEQGKEALEQAKRECEYIRSLIDELQSYRKYAHLPDHEAFQLAQEEEWLEELKWRAENFLGSQGFIPHDHIAAMRMHPEWDKQIRPYVQHLIEASRRNEDILPYHPPPMLEKQD